MNVPFSSASVIVPVSSVRVYLLPGVYLEASPFDPGRCGYIKRAYTYRWCNKCSRLQQAHTHNNNNSLLTPLPTHSNLCHPTPFKPKMVAGAFRFPLDVSSRLCKQAQGAPQLVVALSGFTGPSAHRQKAKPSPPPQIADMSNTSLACALLLQAYVLAIPIAYACVASTTMALRVLTKDPE